MQPFMIKETVYIRLEWQEEGPLPNIITGQRFWRKGRKVFPLTEYLTRLPCNNPNCENGGFEIGDKIEALLAAGVDRELNSLICINAIHPDRAKRCLHIILYSLVCVYPYCRDGAGETGLSLLLKEM